MADGEINVNVRADGVDEAAEDVADGSGADMGGGDGDGGGRGDGLAQSIKGGIGGGLVATLLGPLLDVFEPFVKVLQAFVAPLAQVLLRLFTPVLRLLIGLLPIWYDFLENNEGLLMSLLAGLFPIATYLPAIANSLTSIGQDLASLPGDIVNTLIDRLTGEREPATPSGPRQSGITTSNFTQSRTGNQEPATEFVMDRTPNNGGRREATEINFFGGIEAFFDKITSNRNADTNGVR